MASNTDDDDDMVVLRCIDPNYIEPEPDHEQILISTADINNWDLLFILSNQTVQVKANRNRLIEQSSYFRGLLSGSFSESCLECISIHWRLETFLSVLRCLFDCPVDVTSDNFLSLYEAALFFGVEMLLLKCKIWLTEVTSLKGLSSLQLQLHELIHIWKFGLEHGKANDFIPELCTSYLARNFMWAVCSDSFSDVPCDLFVSCIKHLQLTVDSEKHLCDAVLVWLASNKERLQSLSSNEDDRSCIFKQVWRICANAYVRNYSTLCGSLSLCLSLHTHTHTHG
ncbi:unnamed protein product [Ilex paraguariensis]|uniref:BTB domain-containing protein n=1 Tax=Ilex paraguariensis TaxID=185542 RepID=A0ABC8SRC3_9AQUA